MTRVCRCILPKGSIVNPEFPAAVGMRSLTCARVMDVIFGAFVQVVPDRLAACPASGGSIMNVNSVDDRNGRRVVASIDLPAMIVVGEEDAAFRRAAEVMTARLPRAESLCIPGAGHIVNIAAEAAFNAAATGFLASLAAS